MNLAALKSKLNVQDRYIVMGCNKGQVIAVDIEQPETLYARYQIGSVDDDFVEMQEISKRKVFISVSKLDYVTFFWDFHDGKTRVL
jgi:hypothetical protein